MVVIDAKVGGPGSWPHGSVVEDRCTRRNVASGEPRHLHVEGMRVLLDHFS